MYGDGSILPIISSLIISVLVAKRTAPESKSGINLTNSTTTRSDGLANRPFYTHFFFILWQYFFQIHDRYNFRSQDNVFGEHGETSKELTPGHSEQMGREADIKSRKTFQ